MSDNRANRSPSERLEFIQYQEQRLERLEAICNGMGKIIRELGRRRTDDKMPIDTRIFARSEDYASEWVRLVREIADKKLE